MMIKSRGRYSFSIFFCLWTLSGLLGCSPLGSDSPQSILSSTLPISGGGGYSPATPTEQSAPPLPPLNPLSSVNLISCESAQYELPLSTHWSRALDAVVEGASDSLEVFNPDRRVSRRIYNYNFLPEFHKYIGTDYDLFQMSDTEFKSSTQKVCRDYGVAVELRRPVSFSNWSLSRSALREGRGSIQVIYALRIGGNVLNVFLPPNWKRTDIKGTYPILINGGYDLKSEFPVNGVPILKAMARAWRVSETPMIGVQWNGGGAMASRTTDLQARISFNLIVQNLAEHFGGDTQRIVTMGGSRGGSTALTMAANPEKNPYKVLAALASVPPSDYSFLSKMTNATHPMLLHAAEWSLGLLDTWKKDFRYPQVGSLMDGMTRDQAQLHVLLGSKNELEIKDHLSLSSPRFISALKSAGTQVYLEIGSHDFIVAGADQYRFARRLEQAQIPMELRTNYLAGHWTDTNSATGLSVENLARIMTKVFKKDFTHLVRAGHRAYYRNDYKTGGMKELKKSYFTFEMPRYQSPSIGGQIIMTGLPGTLVEFSGIYTPLSSGVSQSLPTQQAFLDVEGIGLMETSGLEPGKYVVNVLRIKKPGESAWKNIDLKFSTTSLSGGTLVLDVLPTDPSGDTSAEEISWAILKGIIGDNLSQGTNGFTSVNYGVVEVD